MSQVFVSWQDVLSADYPSGAALSEALSSWSRTEPVKRAEFHGHTVEWDPPHGLSSSARWTCIACGSAVLLVGHNIYGSAVDGPCEALLSRDALLQFPRGDAVTGQITR